MFQLPLSSRAPADPTTHTTQPIVTGTSIIGIKYNGGVMLASDTLASYGSLARYHTFSRLREVNKKTLIGASGEISDFQAIIDDLNNKNQEDTNHEDNFVRNSREYFHYLRTVLYNRRNKGNPYWNQVLVAGFDDKTQESFLGCVDLIGTSWEEDFIATGYGAYLAIPLIREKWHKDIDEGEARALLEECLRVLFYRDCRASNRIQIAKVNADGVLISEPYKISTQWETATYDSRHATKMSADGSSW